MRDKQASISAAQIRGARAILDWSQNRLAEATGLSIATIRKLELGHISPRSTTTQTLRQAFETAGLEFSDLDGVRRKPDGVDIYEGDSGVQRFFDDVYRACLNGEEVIQVWPGSQQFNQVIGNYRARHTERMAKIKEQVKIRCIATENPDVIAHEYCAYRFLSNNYVDCVPFYVYGNKYAIVSFPPDTQLKIIVVESSAAAAAFRSQFESMWQKAVPLNKHPLNAITIDQKPKKRVK